VALPKEEFEVGIFCALYEEAEAVKEIFSTLGAEVKTEKDPHIHRDYTRCVVANALGENLKLYLTWLPDYGPTMMAMHGQAVLHTHKDFRILLMTGICAGNKAKVSLGDLIIAKGTYAFDAGKLKPDGQGQYVLESAPDLKSVSDEILQHLRGFDSWKKLVQTEPRPLSKRQQQDELLHRLLSAKSLDHISKMWLRKHVPALTLVLRELKNSKSPILDRNNKLISARDARARFVDQGRFKDPRECSGHICEVASTVAVREDRPFERLKHPIRNTLAIDMEGHAFYQLAHAHQKPALFVKGVCDYADPDKDDSYHKYAARVSAFFAYSYIREFVTKTPSSALHATFGNSVERGANVPFWHTVNDRVRESKDVGSLTNASNRHVIISGIALSYLVIYCKNILVAAIDRGVLVCIILPENSPHSLRSYQRYAQYVAKKLPSAHAMYRQFSDELTEEQRRFFVFVSTSIPLTHSIGLYDSQCYVSEFCIDRSSPDCPSFSPPQGSPTHDLMVAELKTLISEGSILFGGGGDKLGKVFDLAPDD
jgi:nucleoside phosphorylase